MNAKQIADIIARAPKQVERAMRDEIPRKAAIIAKNHFRQNFRDSGFTDDGLHAWKKTRRQEAGSPYKPLTSERNHLCRMHVSTMRAAPFTQILLLHQKCAKWHGLKYMHWQA